MDEDLKKTLEQVIAPLIEADAGELYWIPRETGHHLHLHLRGRFSGCPGNSLVTDHILRPVLEASRPSIQLVVTSGALLPEGSQRIVPTRQGSSPPPSA